MIRQKIQEYVRHAEDTAYVRDLMGTA